MLVVFSGCDGGLAEKEKPDANWKTELEIKVNNKTCTAPECTVLQKDGHYLQSLIIDARAVGAQTGVNCRRKDVIISLEIKPVKQSEVTCKLNKDGNCEATDAWKGYRPDVCYDSCGGGKKEGDKARETYRDEVNTFISHVITF